MENFTFYVVHVLKKDLRHDKTGKNMLFSLNNCKYFGIYHINNAFSSWIS